jgi:hypothetical protein
MPRPPFGSPEWLRYFEEVVRTSKGLAEAADRLGYRTPGTVHYHMRRFAIQSPHEWSRRPQMREILQRNIPQVIIPTNTGRRWVGGLTQGEGCVQARFFKRYDVTYLNLDVSMSDPEPVFTFSDYAGLSHPSKPIKNHDWKPNWHKNVSGLRAFRVLQEIRPFLLGKKLKEVEKALAFFAPYGIHPGCYGNRDIWPTSEFPWRTKRRGSFFGATEMVSTSLTATTSPHLTQSGIQPSPDSHESHNGLGLRNQWKVPEVIIPSIDDRAWAGALVQGEVCIEAHYINRSDSTTLVLDLRMTDSEPVFRFADLCGLPRPEEPVERPNRWQPMWRKSIAGIRALRVLIEIEPFLVGQKRREALRAFEFFDSNGYHRGRFYSSMIRPPDGFPYRRHPVRDRNLPNA